MSPSQTSEAKSAHKAVALTIKNGELHKQPCEVCGKPETSAHHWNYHKPLDVRWLCHLHHMPLHAAQSPKLTDTLLTHQSKALSVSNWAIRYRIHPITLYQRIIRDWPVALALSLRPAPPGLDQAYFPPCSCSASLPCRFAKDRYRPWSPYLCASARLS